MYLANKGVREEATGNYCIVCTGRPFYELCTGAGRMEVSSSFLRWWEQEQGPTQAEREVG